MGRLATCACVAGIVVVGLTSRNYAESLDPPFNIEPFDTDLSGNAAGNLEGSFRVDGGPQQFRYFLGTEPSVGPGRLILDFAVPFTDGPGDDFAILTNSQAWGPLAESALFEFLLNGSLVTSFAASLTPDQLFQFDLPGNDVVANRVIVTNITPDPPGFNDLATMTFDNAGVAYLLAEPVAIDIKPGSESRNSINPKSKGVIPVAILGTTTFDATTIDPQSIEFGLNGATEAHGRIHVSDVNGDGLPDVVLHFETQRTGIRCGDTLAFLRGQTVAGQAVAGSDSIATVGCK
jgi:hypothetical protein